MIDFAALAVSIVVAITLASRCREHGWARITFIVAFICLLSRILWLVGDLLPESAARVTSSNRNVKLGNLFIREDAHCDFHISNDSGSAFVIKRISAGCLCQTDATLVGKTIAAGGEFVVPVQLKRGSVGAEQTTVEVFTTSSDSRYRHIVLKLSAEIQPSVRVSPRVVASYDDIPQKVTLDLDDPRLAAFSGTPQLQYASDLLSVNIVSREKSRLTLAVKSVKQAGSSKNSTDVKVLFGQEPCVFSVLLPRRTEIRAIPETIEFPKGSSYIRSVLLVVGADVDAPTFEADPPLLEVQSERLSPTLIRLKLRPLGSFSRAVLRVSINDRSRIEIPVRPVESCNCGKRSANTAGAGDSQQSGVHIVSHHN